MRISCVIISGSVGSVSLVVSVSVGSVRRGMKWG